MKTIHWKGYENLELPKSSRCFLFWSKLVAGPYCILYGFFNSSFSVYEWKWNPLTHRLGQSFTLVLSGLCLL